MQGKPCSGNPARYCKKYMLHDNCFPKSTRNKKKEKEKNKGCMYRGYLTGPMQCEEENKKLPEKYFQLIDIFLQDVLG